MNDILEELRRTRLTNDEIKDRVLSLTDYDLKLFMKIYLREMTLTAFADLSRGDICRDAARNFFQVERTYPLYDVFVYYVNMQEFDKWTRQQSQEFQDIQSRYQEIQELIDKESPRLRKVLYGYASLLLQIINRNIMTPEQEKIVFSNIKSLLEHHVVFFGPYQEAFEKLSQVQSLLEEKMKT